MTLCAHVLGSNACRAHDTCCRFHIGFNWLVGYDHNHAPIYIGFYSQSTANYLVSYLFVCFLFFVVVFWGLISTTATMGLITESQEATRPQSWEDSIYSKHTYHCHYYNWSQIPAALRSPHSWMDEVQNTWWREPEWGAYAAIGPAMTSDSHIPASCLLSAWTKTTRTILKK